MITFDTDLPDKPSELILRAIKDVETALDNYNYVFNLHVWHEPTYDKNTEKRYCHICLAGGIIAANLKFNVRLKKSIMDFQTGVSLKLRLLDKLILTGKVNEFVDFFDQQYRVFQGNLFKNRKRFLELKLEREHFEVKYPVTDFSKKKTWLLKVVELLQSYELPEKRLLNIYKVASKSRLDDSKAAPYVFIAKNSLRALLQAIFEEQLLINGGSLTISQIREYVKSYEVEKINTGIEGKVL